MIQSGTDEQFGLTKQKIHNELNLGRVGNMRSKATRAVRDQVTSEVLSARWESRRKRTSVRR